MNATHIRKGKVIRQLPQPAVLDDEGNEKKPAVEEVVETFKSVNAAKRASRTVFQKRPGVVLRVAK